MKRKGRGNIESRKANNDGVKKGAELEKDDRSRNEAGSRAPEGKLASELGSNVCGVTVPADPLSDADERMSDDDGPEIEGATMARERVELQAASESAARERRIAERKARAREKEAAAVARKAAKRDRFVAGKASAIPEDVLDQAANEAEMSVARESAQAKIDSVRKQSGTAVVPTRRKVVDGVEVVNLSRPEAGVAKRTNPVCKAQTFLRKCMYGRNAKRVKAAVSLRKNAAVRQVNGKARHLSTRRTGIRR